MLIFIMPSPSIFSSSLPCAMYMPACACSHVCGFSCIARPEVNCLDSESSKFKDAQEAFS